ncbi:MAG: acyl-CoA dehydrogenase [Sphingomonadales bacterium]|nr:acyl-CoA dehydrogenase [Sphingomonadales bacterium]
MDFTLNDDQHLLLTSFESLLDRYRALPVGEHGYAAWSAAFQQELADSGFAEVAATPGFGPLEAALLIEAAATCPLGVEAATSMLVGPLIGQSQAPIALASAVGKPVRYLAQARTLCLFDGEDVLVATPRPGDFTPLSGVSAYPMARLDRMPADARRVGNAAAIRRRAAIGLAAEAAGLMRGSLDHTVAYVKERHQFGQPLAAFQAIQHRLAECAQIVQAARLLAFRAAHADDGTQAAIAALYAQDAMRKVITDCHQFCGAMGLTLEFPLHLWTYRLKVLQGEMGGRAAQARAVSHHTWQSTNIREREDA